MAKRFQQSFDRAINSRNRDAVLNHLTDSFTYQGWNRTVPMVISRWVFADWVLASRGIYGDVYEARFYQDNNVIYKMRYYTTVIQAYMAYSGKVMKLYMGEDISRR
ncbi:unnamed protein product [Caenorhabditis sp. 36 PRJEB53466]|nr:unnamed protein product [Caenorhabditis sp. 36 PRJEB53466]